MCIRDSYTTGQAVMADSVVCVGGTPQPALFIQVTGCSLFRARVPLHCPAELQWASAPRFVELGATRGSGW
eukprot:155620-Alexandrium_andersonii.AAC.1